MPKRVGHLYEKLFDRDFVRGIVTEACKHRKKSRRDVAKVKADIDGVTEKLCRMFETDSFKPSPVHERTLYDQSSEKTRVITTVPFFPDCLVQWCVVELLKEPVLMRGMDYYCSSSIPGRGGERIYRAIKRQLGRKHKNSVYALQCDVRHYYDSIDIKLLMERLGRRCKDRRLLSLVSEILYASAPEEGKGLRIGFYLNQWLANFFLEETDRSVRRSGLAPFYVRYMDNLTAIGPNKRLLARLRRTLKRTLRQDGLELKADWQVFKIASRPIRAVGYRFCLNGSVLLRQRNWLKLRRTCLRIRRAQEKGEKIDLHRAQSAMSRLGVVKRVANYKIWREYIAFVDRRKLIEVLRA